MQRAALCLLAVGATGLADGVDAQTIKRGEAMTAAEMESVIATPPDGAEVGGMARLVAMVRPGTTEGMVEMSATGCEGWVEVPSSVVAEARELGTETCPDGAHRVFEIDLSPGGDDTAQGLARLVGAMASVGPPVGDQPAASNSNIANAGSLPGGGLPGPLVGQLMALGAGDVMASPSGGPQSSALMQRPDAFGADNFVGGGTVAAWGCWDSTCTRCLRYRRVCNGTACWSVCVTWSESACERCIWPW